MMPEPGVAMKISTLWEERKVIFTPMEHGLRASGIAEFAVREAPPRYALAERLKRSALALIPGLKDAGSRQWMGRRPVTPDYLPVIGRAPRHPKVIFAFGQRLAAPVTVYVEQFSAHPLEADAAELYGAPDGWLGSDGQVREEQRSPGEKPVYAVELRPEDGVIRCPTWRGRRTAPPGRRNARSPALQRRKARQGFFPDGSRSSRRSTGYRSAKPEPAT